MRPGFRWIPLALALCTAALPACAETIASFTITNGSQYPLLGFESVSAEPDKFTLSKKGTIFLSKPLLPGATITITTPVDEGLVARGGEQQLRWHWTSSLMCWGYTSVKPTGGAVSVTTGEPVCKAMPTNDMIILVPGMQAVDAIAAKGNLAGAIFEINAMLRHYPGLPMLLHRRGVFYVYAGLADEAEADFQAEAINDRGHLFYDQATIHYARGEGDAALVAISRALEYDPGNVEYLGNRAFMSCQATDFEQMRKDEAAIAALGGPQPRKRGPDCRPQ